MYQDREIYDVTLKSRERKSCSCTYSIATDAENTKKMFTYNKRFTDNKCQYLQKKKDHGPYGVTFKGAGQIMFALLRQIHIKSISAKRRENREEKSLSCLIA